MEHFSDAFWKIDAAAGLTKKINTGENENIDSTNLVLSQDSEFLFFTNKSDGSLWSLHLVAAPVATPAPTLPVAR